MTSPTITFTNGRVFDGANLHTSKFAQFRDGVFTELVSSSKIAPGADIIDLDGDILAPGYVDLQVNGGGGVMFNDDPSRATLETIAAAHRTLGCTAILPTLITSDPRTTSAAIDAVRSALKAGVPGIAGLHLEGPHLSVARKGAHDASLIRPMQSADLDQLLAAKADIPVLKVTVAPENVSIAQVQQMAQAGILVSLGHSDADFQTCCAYADAGARCVTHLFNAMSQLGNRQPGLVGAALTHENLSAGLIADGFHVHPASMKAAWSGKNGSGGIYLVSDAMAVAGTSHAEFHLDGRRITRSGGTLTLKDGTLAGADLDLTTALRVLVDQCGVDLQCALRAATSTPAELIGLSSHLQPGKTRLSDLNRISRDLDRVSQPRDFAVH